MTSRFKAQSATFSLKVVQTAFTQEVDKCVADVSALLKHPIQAVLQGINK